MRRLWILFGTALVMAAVVIFLQWFALPIELYGQDTTAVTRDATEIRLPGGQRQMVIQSGQNWQDSTGAWRRFRPRLRAYVRDNYDFVHDEAGYVFRADKDTPEWLVTSQGVGVGTRPLQVNGGFTTARDDGHVYAHGIWDSTHVVIALVPEGIKVDYVLMDKAAPDSLVFGMAVAGATPALTPGGVQLGPFFMPTPTAVDATGNSVPVTIDWRTVAPGTYVLGVEVDTAGAVYPVTIDPTLMFADSVSTYEARAYGADYATQRGATTASDVNVVNYVGQTNNRGDGDPEVNRYFVYYPLVFPSGIVLLDSARIDGYGAANASTRDTVINIYRGRQHTQLSTAQRQGYTGLFNDFDGWQTGTSAYTGTVLSNNYNTNQYGAGYGNIFRFNAAGLDSIRAAIGDTLKLAFVHADDANYNVPATGAFVGFDRTTNAPKLILYYHTVNAAWGDAVRVAAHTAWRAWKETDIDFDVARDSAGTHTDTTGAITTNQSVGAYTVARGGMVFALTGLPAGLQVDSARIGMVIDTVGAPSNYLTLFEGTFGSVAGGYAAASRQFRGFANGAPHAGPSMNRMFHMVMAGQGDTAYVRLNSVGDSLIQASLGDTAMFVLTTDIDSSDTAPTNDVGILDPKYGTIFLEISYQSSGGSIVSGGSRGTVLYEKNGLPGYVRHPRAINETKKRQ